VARAVRFDLIADSSKFTRGMRDAQRSSEKFTQHTNRAGQALKTAFAAFSAGAAIMEMHKWVDAARDSNRVTAQVNAVIKSTHGAAGLSAKGFADLAKSIEKTAAVDDDVIAGGEAILATFTNIKAGGPDKVFERATQAAVDMTAALNHGQVTAEGLQSANILLGKALQDPIGGLTRLQRIGVSFSAQQKEQIADFVKHGQVAKAQGVIIAEVNREFGGSAAAAVTPAKKLAAEWGDMQEILGNLLIPAIDRGAQILSSILGVVDRNRTAFGVLFGVLGTGAAVIGTLIVAEKVHAAVTDAVKVATVSWAAVQKGMNVILGTTALQAKATAEAEGGLAASTAAAGASSAGMRASMLTAVPVLGALAFGFIASKDAIKDNVSLFDELRSKLGFHVKAIDDAKAGTVAAAVANQKLAADAAAAGVSEGQLAGKTLEQGRALVDTTAKTNEFKAKLKEARDELKQNRDSMAQTIESYDGLLSKSKVTAKSIIGDLRQQTANFVTFAADVKYLIHKGIGQDALGWLEAKGPEYVHGLAVGSDKQLAIFQRDWKTRGNAIKGPFAAAMNAQYKKLNKTIEDMQNKINELSGKTIYLTAKASVEINKSVKLYLQSIPNLKAFHAKGARIPGYGGGDIYPAMLEPGETVVSKESSKLPYMQEAFMAAGVPGYQLGGLAFRYRNPVARKTWKIGRQMDDIAAAAIGMLAERGKAAMGGGAFTGGAASGNVIRLALAQAKRMAASFKVALSLIEAGIVESGLRNLPYGDRDSLGFLQQRPSQGWRHPMNISYASWDFLRRAIPIQGRYGTAGALAQAVQRSAFPGRYDQQQARALGILHTYGYDRGGLLPPGLSVAYNGTGRPEPVGSATQHVTIIQVDRQVLARIVNDGGVKLARLA